MLWEILSFTGKVSLCRPYLHEALTHGGRIRVHSQPVGRTNLVQDPDLTAEPKSFWIGNSKKLWG